jgi:anti-anti-sigma factor
MDINIETRNSVCHARMTGEMTIYHAAELKGKLLPHLDCCNEMEINLSEVSEIDTAGIQLLLLAKLEALRANKLLRFVAHSPAMLEVLELLNLASHFADPVAVPRAAT